MPLPTTLKVSDPSNGARNGSKSSARSRHVRGCLDMGIADERFRLPRCNGEPAESIMGPHLLWLIGRKLAARHCRVGGELVLRSEQVINGHRRRRGCERPVPWWCTSRTVRSRARHESLAECGLVLCHLLLQLLQLRLHLLDLLDLPLPRYSLQELLGCELMCCVLRCLME